jgi:cold-inducible RNA-binding protein
MNSRLYIGNVARNVTANGLRDFIVACGLPIMRVSLVMDRATGHSRGFAFIEFAGATGAARAMGSLEGASIEGRPLRLRRAEEHAPPPER